MRSGNPTRGLIVLVVLTLMLPSVAAVDLYVDPATPQAERTAKLFNIITWTALVVFVFTEALLFYVIWRFRKNRVVPKGETHRGHTKAEIIWTLIPALILIVIGVLSVQTLAANEEMPADVRDRAIPIDVEASRFSWLFSYPEQYGGGTSDKLWVREGETVRLLVTSVDNQHAFNVPEFNVLVDAYPGRVNEVWFTAPQVGAAGVEYFVQCREYCGFGHHGMRTSVFVYDAADARFEGQPVRAFDPNAAKDVPPGPEETVTLVEKPGPETNPWSIDPYELTITVAAGEGIHLDAVNAEANRVPHNLTIEGKLFNGGAYPAGASRWLNFTQEELDTVLGGPGRYEYWCAVPGHKETGMRGFITVEKA